MIQNARGCVVLFLFALALVLGGPRAAFSQSATLDNAAQIERGEALYTSKGCFECHGRAAQGAMGVAPSLFRARTDAQAFETYIRHPAGQMPPYGASMLAPADVQAIVAYLRSLGNPRDASEIPMLRPYVAQRSSNAQTQAPPAASRAVAAEVSAPDLYRQHCAPCHGPNREGGMGPSLVNEASRRNVAAIDAFIRNPPAPMPKLYPSPLSAAAVAALAAYIHASDTQTNGAGHP